MVKILDALDTVGGVTLYDAKGDLLAASGADTPAKVTVGANGKVLAADSAAGSGVAWVDNHEIEVYSVPGVLVVGARPVPFIIPSTMTFVDTRLAVGTAPTGAAILVDVNKNGTTLYSTQGNRPTIAISATSGAAAVPVVTALAAGDLLTVDIDQVGSTIAGSNLGIVIRMIRA